MLPPFAFIKKASTFNPAARPLEGWWRGSYAGSPWVGVASSGGSGGRSLSEATNPPSAGAAVNGFAPASFDGVNDQFVGSTLSTYVSASAYFWWALFYSEASGGSNSLASQLQYQNPCLFTDGGGWMGASFYNAIGVEKIQVWHAPSAGSWSGNEHTITLNAWTLITARYDGVNIRSRVNSGSVSSAAAGNIGSAVSPLVIGRNLGSAFQKVRVLDIGFSQSAESDARFDDIRSYVNARYLVGV